MNPEIQQYISQFPENIQKILLEIREMIFKEVPDAEEKISYAIPGFYFKGKPLVYFAAFKNHIGFYATPEVHDELKEKLSHFKQGKGSVQFPFSKEIPFDLIYEMIQLKKQNLQNKK